MEKQAPEKKPVLEYATPLPRRRRPGLGLVVTLVAAMTQLIGVIMLSGGVDAAWYAFTQVPSSVFGYTLFQAIVFVLIAVLCFFLGTRWFRAVPRIILGGEKEKSRVEGESE